ncbi:MAG: FAD-binding oxidoreductase [Elusimicrobiota bacterium]
MSSSVWIDELKKIVGAADLIEDPDRLASFAGDEFSLPTFRQNPLAAVRPHNAEEISRILKLANQHKIPVTPRGGGTGLCGACVPSPEGIVLLFDHLNRVLEVDKENLMVSVEAGVPLHDLYAVIEKDGLFFPPHPGADTAQIGGVIATNAGGSRAVKYGTLRNFLRGAEVVLPQGEILQLGGKLVKNSTGFNLLHLLVGSEGLLGVFTKAVIALLPKPRHTATLIVPYPTIAQAIGTVPEIIRRNLEPLAVEFMEADSIALTEERLHRKWPAKGAQAYLMIIVEASGLAELEALWVTLQELCEKHGAGEIFVAESESQQKDVLDFRSQMYEAMKPLCLEILDIVVPRSAIAAHVEAVHAIERKFGVWLPTYGHAGDGNVHSHIMRVAFKDGKPDFRKQLDWDALYHPIRDALHADARQRGGMVSGEHGIGLAKKEYLSEFVGPGAVTLMRGIKYLLDPNHILNPGKVF